MKRPSPDRLEPLRRIAQLVPGGMALGRRLRRLTDPDLREIERLRSQLGPSLLQPFPDTFEERYPDLFDALAKHLEHLPEPRILSFGCSSGAEVRALRRRMPAARLVGVDPNRRAIAVARKADPAGDYRIQGTVPNGEGYDSILAMAVLRHGQLEAKRPASADPVFPFRRFEEALDRLDIELNVGGLIAIGHAHFRFADWPGAVRYVAVPDVFAHISTPGLLYWPDNRRIDGPPPIAVLHRKLRH